MKPKPAVAPGEPHVHAPQLTKYYLVAFGVVLLLLLAGQWLVQRSIEIQAGDGRVINLAGRQRMLSQKLAKAALVLTSPMDPVTRQQALGELRETVEKWEQSHRSLQNGDAAAGIRPNNSLATRSIYASIQTHHEVMLRAARQLAERCSRLETMGRQENLVDTETILREESAFLTGMDAIVRNYELENQGRITLLRCAEIVLAATMLLTLIIEALFIFRPAIRQILQAGEARYRELFENAVEGIFESTQAGRFLNVNPALARMLGYQSPAEMMQRVTSIDTDLYAQPGRRAELLAQLRERDSVLGFESEVKCRDGTTRWVSKNIRAVRAETAAEVRLQGFVVDITGRRRSEQEWLRASKLESVGILAGGIAHDFNNMLTGIMGNIALARMDGAAVPGVVQALREAERATKRARDLTQQLLTFAKGGAPVRSTLRLDAIMREVAEFSLHGSKTRCEYDLPSDLWPANADRGQISRVVQNLIINAMQAMPDGGVVTIRARNEQVSPAHGSSLTPGDYVKISISDQGMGIPSEHLSKIFDPYFTTKESGTGLGLAAVYSIVKKHLGLIEVESASGVGSTFHIWLPAVCVAQTEAAKTEAEDARPIPQLKGRLLFMDDEVPIRTMAKSLLGRLGLEVTLVANGAEAVDCFLAAGAADRPFDVVVLDLTVPGGMGGLEALQRMRAHDPSVRAIVSSGYAKDPIIAEHRSHGFLGCVAKPYCADEFAQVLREVLGQSPHPEAAVAK